MPHHEQKPLSNKVFYFVQLKGFGFYDSLYRYYYFHDRSNDAEAFARFLNNILPPIMYYANVVRSDIEDPDAHAYLSAIRC